MAEEAKDVAQKAEQEKKLAEEAKAKADADAKAKADAEAKENATVGKLFKKGDKESKVVPEAVLIETKKALKEANAKIKELTEQGASKGEIAKSLKDIAEKYEVDEAFVADIADALNANAKATIEEVVSSKLKPLEERDQQEKTDKIFGEHYDRTMVEMPEYAKLVNKDVIKSLALNPANANKTLPQIIEEAYGHLVGSQKKSIERSRPRADGGNVSIDFERAKKDKEYFNEIMSDPTTKAEYNKDLAKRLRL